MSNERSEKAIADILALLLVLAITITLSGSFVQLTKEISKQIKVQEELSVQSTLQGNTIQVKNTYPVSLNLKDVKIIVNGEEIPIKDENGNGIWDPFETISFKIPTSESVLDITIYYKGNQILHAIYIKPEILNEDKQFPTLNVENQTTGGNLELTINASDDLGLKSIKVYLGNLNGTLIPDTSVDLLKSLSKQDLKELARELKQFYEEKCKKAKQTRHEHRNEEKTREHEKHGMWKTKEKHSKKYSKPRILQKLRNKKLELYYNLKNLEEKNIAYLLVRATDLTGKTSQKVIILPTLKAKPNIVLNIPEKVWTTSDKAVVEYTVRITDNYGLKRVRGSIDGTELFNESIKNNKKNFEKSGRLTLDIGVHTLSIEVANIFNKIATLLKSITVLKDNPPTVKITSPANGSRIVNPFTVTAVVNDDIGISKVEFYVNNKLVKTFTNGRTGAYSLKLSIMKSPSTIKVIAYDTAGQKAEDSITVRIDYPPLVSITYPRNNEVFHTIGKYPLLVTADASDDVGVTKVVFHLYEGGKLVKEVVDSKAPYSALFDLGIGDYKITATAYDTAGQSSSNEVMIHVVKDAPPVLLAYVGDGGDSS